MADAGRENLCLDLLLERLRSIDGRSATIVARPERDKTHLVGPRPADAIVESDGRLTAVEHTSIDMLPDERRHRHRFGVVVLPLEGSIPPAFPDHGVSVCVRFGAIPEGVGWEELALSLDAAIKELIPSLPEMRSAWEPSAPWRAVPGLPFEVRAHRWPRPGRGRCMVSQEITQQQGAHLPNDVLRAISAKRDLFSEYSRQKYRTMLILDSDEVDIGSIAAAFREDRVRDEAARPIGHR
jgi:hypothetical protein